MTRLAVAGSPPIAPEFARRRNNGLGQQQTKAPQKKQIAEPHRLSPCAGIARLRAGDGRHKADVGATIAWVRRLLLYILNHLIPKMD
jgi:hypothetical protein